MASGTTVGSQSTVQATRDESHTHYDAGYKAAFAEMGNLLTQLADEISILRERYDNEEKGVFIRNADKVGNDDIAIANRASLISTIKDNGLLETLEREMANPTPIDSMSSTAARALQSSFNSTSSLQRDIVATSNGELRSQDVSVSRGDVVPITGNGAGTVAYHPSMASPNPEKQRNLPIQVQLYEILQTAASAAGVECRIFSGGQVAIADGGIDGFNRIGTNRHDNGYAADIWLYPSADEDGNVNDNEILSQNNSDELPVIIKFIEECKNAGATAVGTGLPYMTANDLGGNGIHVDISSGNTVQSTASYWGGAPIDGRYRAAGAPTWLREIMIG